MHISLYLIEEQDYLVAFYVGEAFGALLVSGMMAVGCHCELEEIRRQKAGVEVRDPSCSAGYAVTSCGMDVGQLNRGMYGGWNCTDNPCNKLRDQHGVKF